MLKQTTQKISLLSKNTKKYLETLSDEDHLAWQKSWRSAHESFIAITFLPMNENFSEIEAWPLSPGFLDSLENYPYSGIVNDSTIQITPEVLKTQHMITDPSEISLGFHVLEYYAFERNSEDLNGSEEIKKRRRSLISVVSDLLVEEIKKLENEPHKKLETSYPELIAHMKDKVQGIHIEIRSAEHCVYSRSSDEIVKYQLMIFNEIFKNTLEIDKYLEKNYPKLNFDEVDLIATDIQRRYDYTSLIEHIDEKIKEMVNIDRPVIFDCLVDKAENCFPMIPSGKPHNQMILGPEEEEEISDEGKILV